MALQQRKYKKGYIITKTLIKGMKISRSTLMCNKKLLTKFYNGDNIVLKIGINNKKLSTCFNWH